MRLLHLRLAFDAAARWWKARRHPSIRRLSYRSIRRHLLGALSSRLLAAYDRRSECPHVQTFRGRRRRCHSLRGHAGPHDVDLDTFEEELAGVDESTPGLVMRPTTAELILWACQDVDRRGWMPSALPYWRAAEIKAWTKAATRLHLATYDVVVMWRTPGLQLAMSWGSDSRVERST